MKQFLKVQITHCLKIMRPFVSPEQSPNGSKYLKFFRTPKSDTAKCLLFCFHAAGGSFADFRRWPELGDSHDCVMQVVGYALPGHVGRLGEKPSHSITEMVKVSSIAFFSLRSIRRLLITSFQFSIGLTPSSGIALGLLSL